MAAHRSNQIAVVFAVLVSVVSSVAVLADDPLARAKELYESAAYEEALAVLDELQGQTTNVNATEVAQYRAFCLFALERPDEARKAVETLVNTDPFYQLSDLQTSPRIRNVFQEIRRTLLPKIVQRSYEDAKASFDRKDPQAASQFDDVVRLLDDPDMFGAAGLADLRVVAAGFRDLSKAMAPAAPASASATPAAGPETARPGGPPVVVPPVVVSQALPSWTAPVAVRRVEYNGTVEVAIDEQGKVAGVTLSRSVHPLYDPELLRAARNWTYKPATKDGTPIAFVKVVDVQLRPSD